MAGNGPAASAFMESFLKGYNFVQDMQSRQREERRQSQLDVENKQYRDATLDLQRQHLGLAGMGSWSAPSEAVSDETGKPAFISSNSRTGEIRGLAGWRPAPPEPKYDIKTYKDDGYEVTRRTVNGDPVGDPIGRSPIRQDVSETFSNPVDEVDPSGTPIRVQYGNRGTRRVIESAKSAPAALVSPKSMPAAVQRMEDDDLEALYNTSSTQADMKSFLQQIESGDLQLGPAANVMNRARNATGVDVTPQSMNYASFRAALEKMRNDSLRLNKGVQTEGDAVRAWNELITNINDPKVVSQRLQEIANLNARAMALYGRRIQERRGNYHQEPIDLTQFTADRSAYGSGQAQPPADMQAPLPAAADSSGKDYSHLWE